MAFEQLIPSEVQAAFDLAPIADASLVSGGMINRTVIADTSHGRNVVQRLSPIFAEAQIDDYAAVVPGLRTQGWEVPELILTTTGENRMHDDKGGLWRGFEFIPSDESLPRDSKEARVADPAAYGEILARLHRTLRTIDYSPTFQLPHFHDTPYYAAALEEVVQGIPTTRGVDIANTALSAYETVPPLPDTTQQLIHGDPRTANILHREGKPFTFIDWDTLMLGTIWMDIGDLLRSLSEDAVLNGDPVPVATLGKIAEGYRQVAFPEVAPDAFRQQAFTAGQRIAAELAMRFIADYQDGDAGYFQFDPSKYLNRHAFTAERAALQLDIYKQLESVNSAEGVA